MELQVLISRPNDYYSYFEQKTLIAFQMPHAKPLDDFEIMECIDAGLNRFGPGIKYAVYWTSVVMNNSPSEGILTHPENFVAALQKIFGKSAAQIEVAICKEIQIRAGPSFSGPSLPELIAQIRSHRMLAQTLA